MTRLAASLAWSTVISFTACSDSSWSPDAATCTTLAAVPDLRFKFVAAFPAFTDPAMANLTSLGDHATLELAGGQNGAWSPFELGAGDTWSLFEFIPGTAISPITSHAQSGPLAQAPTELAAFTASQVITALDYTSDAYAATADWTDDADPHNTFTATFGSVTAPAGLAAYVSMQAANRGVVTALGFDGTAIRVASYVLQGDPASYETSVVAATAATIADRATALASGGYLITAIGRSSATDYALVGTRPTGVTAAREVMTVATTATADLAHAFGQGFVIVGSFTDATSHGLVVVER